jgi:hypothetical protein
MNVVWGRVRPLVFRTIIGAVVAAGIVGVFAVLVGDFGTVAIQLLLTILVVVVFALLSWYDADVSSKRSGTFAMASVLASLYLLVVGFLKIWIVRPTGFGSGWDVTTQFWQWIGLAVVARAALLHVHLLLIIHRRFPTPVLQVVAKTTVGIIALLAVLVSLPLLLPHVHFADGYWRLLWVVVILDLLGTVIVPLSNALFRPRHGLEARPASAPPPPSAPWPGPAGAPAAPGSVPQPGVATGWTTAPFADGPPQFAPAPMPSAPSPVRPGFAGAGALVYEREPEARNILAWPRYVDGTPLPALPDGSPDFSGVERR